MPPIRRPLSSRCSLETLPTTQSRVPSMSRNWTGNLTTVLACRHLRSTSLSLQTLSTSHLLSSLFFAPSIHSASNLARILVHLLFSSVSNDETPLSSITYCNKQPLNGSFTLNVSLLVNSPKPCKRTVSTGTRPTGKVLNYGN